MKKNEKIWTLARDAALRVDFIINGRELYLYTNAIYTAMLWGWSGDIEKKEKEISVKQVLEEITF